MFRNMRLFERSAFGSESSKEIKKVPERKKGKCRRLQRTGRSFREVSRQNLRIQSKRRHRRTENFDEISFI